jgi:hypothetical protein
LNTGTRGWACKVLDAVDVFFVLPHEFFTFVFAKGTVFFLVLTLNTQERHMLPFCEGMNQFKFI